MKDLKDFTEEEKQELDAAFNRVGDQLDRPRPDVKLRGKTYANISDGTMIAAARLLDLAKNDDMLRMMGMNVIQRILQRKGLASKVEAPTQREMDAAFWEGLESIFSYALATVRQKGRGMDAIEHDVHTTVESQSKVALELKDNPDMKLLMESGAIEFSSIGNLVDQLKDVMKEEEEEYHPHGYL